MSEEKNKGGRPRVEIDLDMLKNLVRIQCSAEECAKVLEVGTSTIDRRLKEEGYAGFEEFYKKHSEEGRASIRRAQFKLGVEQMNPTMLVWLGKQHLGQKDKTDVNHGAQDSLANLMQEIDGKQGRIPNEQDE